MSSMGIDEYNLITKFKREIEIITNLPGNASIFIYKLYFIFGENMSIRMCKCMKFELGL